MEQKPKILEYLDEIAHIIPAPFYWLNRNHVLLGANQIALNSIGVDLENAIGKTAYDVYPKDLAEKIIRHNEEVMLSGQTLYQEEVVKDITTSGIKYFTAIKSPLRDDSGKVIGLIGASIEITAEKEAEQIKLEAHKKEQEQQYKFRKTVEQVAHDLGSPLMVLNSLLPDCNALPEDYRRLLRSAASRIYDISSNMLGQFKPKEDLAEPKRITLISSNILEILAEKRYEYNHKSIEFVSDISTSGYFAFININSSMFKRMLSNLINNSVDALDDRSGEVKVHLDVIANSQIQIIVEDNGKGMPEEVQHKIMDNMKVTSGKNNGHGIGFEQIRDTLASNAGKFEIDSKLGSGTKVTITFPKVEAPIWMAEKISLNRGDVLVVVDDENSIHGAWDKRLAGMVNDISLQHFVYAKDALYFVRNLSDSEKQKVFLLTDYEFLNQNINGLDVIEQSGVRRSVLVTSHHANHKIQVRAEQFVAKILPKELAFVVQIYVS